MPASIGGPYVAQPTSTIAVDPNLKPLQESELLSNIYNQNQADNQYEKFIKWFKEQERLKKLYGENPFIDTTATGYVAPKSASPVMPTITPEQRQNIREQFWSYQPETGAQNIYAFKRDTGLTNQALSDLNQRWNIQKNRSSDQNVMGAGTYSQYNPYLKPGA